MIKHVILWKLREDIPKEDVPKIKEDVKRELEGLKGKIEGRVNIEVYIGGLASSNADMMLDSVFVDEAALKGYAIHPEHVKVADNYVRPYTEVRMCLDYEV